MNLIKQIFIRGYNLIRKTSIFKRLLVSFLLIIIIPSIVLVNLIYRVVEKEFYETGINYVYQNLDIATQKVYEQLIKYEELGETIEKNREFIKKIDQVEYLNRNFEMEEHDLLKKEIEAYLHEMGSKYKVANISIISDENYYRVVNLDEKSIGGELVSIDKFKQSEVYQTTINSPSKVNWINTKSESDMYYKMASKSIYLGNYLTVTHKILDEQKNIKYIIVINMNTTVISGLVNINKLYNQDLFLIDPMGMITYLSPYYNYYDFPKDLWSQLTLQGEEVLEYEINGEDTLFVTQSLGKSNWSVVSIILKDRLLHSAYEVKDLVKGMIIATGIFSLIICIMVTYSISYPLKRLKNAMGKFAKADFYIEYEDGGKDQIAEVSRIFNVMVKRIQRLVVKQIQDEIAIKEEKIKQKEMHVSALQLQINPHFLYNMLDLIRWHTVHLEKGNGKVSRMMSGFSNMLKYNIKLGEGCATIVEELDYTKRYLQLIDLLYEKHIELKIQANQIDLNRIEVNKLLFQPILENTVVHGKIHLQEKPIIEIIIEKQDEILRIKIRNNGQCIEDTRMDYINENLRKDIPDYKSVGLKNVNQRIKLLFGEQFGLEIVKEFEMTAIQIKVPIREGGKG